MRCVAEKEPTLVAACGCIWDREWERETGWQRREINKDEIMGMQTHLLRGRLLMWDGEGR